PAGSAVSAGPAAARLSVGTDCQATPSHWGSTGQDTVSRSQAQLGADSGSGENSGSGNSGGSGGSGGNGSRWLLFEVMDTGIGIAQEGLAALFKEFVQGTDDDMRKPRTKGGTGLGLSICSKQVGVLGGRIGAYSALGQGSVFWF
ncbi:uncharacterized protein HaLaN_16127, partial [Haematococcus lacustris]